MADLKSKIDQQLRDSLLDLTTQQQLVQVAHSNLDLATTALDQASQRYRAGIDDNLPLVQAQSTLSNAQSQYVNTVTSSTRQSSAWHRTWASSTPNIRHI